MPPLDDLGKGPVKSFASIGQRKGGENRSCLSNVKYGQILQLCVSALTVSSLVAKVPLDEFDVTVAKYVQQTRLVGALKILKGKSSPNFLF